MEYDGYVYMGVVVFVFVVAVTGGVESVWVVLMYWPEVVFVFLMFSE